MTRRIVHVLAAVGVVAGLTVAAWVPPAAAVTFTRITTPSGTTSFRAVPGAVNQFTVKGQASPGISLVDIVCTTQSPGPSPRAYPFAMNVSVSVGSGKFTGTATYPSPLTPTPPGSCRLRAVPSGVDPTNPSTYLGSYAGPLLHTDVLTIMRDGATPFGFQATVGDGDGALAILDAADCGVLLFATFPRSTLTPGHFLPSCVLGLSGPNLANTASAITVSGHGAYLPGTVHGYLKGVLTLGVSQPALDVHMKIASNGDVTITESATLVRCSNGDAFPPTSISCPSLVSAGVTFERVSTFFRDGHQVRTRDTFTSSDSHHHTVNLDYLSKYSPPVSGEVGFTFPGHSSQFHAPALSAKITGLGSKSGTVFVRSDLHASSDDANADTRGLTWSRPPAKITFDDTDVGTFAMPYSVSVPANGRGYLGFADSEGTFTSDVKKLGTAAVHDMVEPPKVTSPHAGATVHGKKTKVEGTVSVGANGLPTKVLVNKHTAQLGATSLAHGAWHVAFDESLGKHTITVTAIDRAGNTASRSIKIRNK